MTVFPRLAIVAPSTDRSVFLTRPFYPQARDGDATNPCIAVATGFAEHGLELLKLAGLSTVDAQAIVAAATSNTATGSRDWQVAEKSGLLFKKPSILRAIGDASVPIGPMTTEPFGVDDLSTDLILDAPFMAKASALLGSNDLIAVIPKRGWLTVGRCQPGEIPVMDRFAKTAAGIASRAGRSALTTNCYFMQNGVVHGITDGSYVSLLTNQTYRWNLG